MVPSATGSDRSKELNPLPTVLGVDSSTQSTKVELRDADSGALLAKGKAPHPGTTPPRSEQDPSCWLAAFDAAVADAGHPAFDAVSVAGQQHGMVVLDGSGTVLRPAKLWNDTESAPDAHRLIDELPGGRGAWAQACGSVPVAAFTITKLSWLHRVEPVTFARLRRVLLPHDWLTFQFTGEATTDRGDASGTGYWSPAAEQYRFDLLRLVDPHRDWAEAVPVVADPLAAMVHRRRRCTVVACGTGDNMAAALGLGLTAGDACISIGTSGTVFTVADEPSADATGAVAGFADATGRYLPLVCTLNATKVTDTVAHLLGVDHATFDALTLAAEPGAGGLTVVPYFDGERTPDRPRATGTVAGLRTDATREQLARAAVEGVVCGLLDGLDALRTTVHMAGDAPIVLVGGGARSAAYRQVLADLTGAPTLVPEADELVALGACVQAAAALHQRPHADVAQAWGVGRGTTTEPHPSVDRAAIRARYAEHRG